jgi:hypothetical protein
MRQMAFGVARSFAFLVGLAMLLTAGAASDLAAQELEPGAYTVSPVGINVFNVGYVFNTGDVNFDPSLPVEEASAEIHTVSLSYARAASLAGRSATLLVAVPLVDGHLEGLVAGQFASADRFGTADMRVRVGVNLYGSPARRMPEFATTPPSKLNVGASVMVVMPTGQYDPARLVNLGTNRWAFKPEAAIIRTLGPWMFEIYAGAWLFTDNDDFYGGVTRSQDPLASFQFSFRRTFKPGMWLSANANFYSGGRTHIGGIAKQDFQTNSRIGTTFAFPLSARNALRVAVSRGAYTTIGSDFVGISASFQQLF